MKKLSFNLIDEPWIQCKYVKGNDKLVSIQDLFDNIGEIEDLTSNNPLVKGSLYRLMIAIVHRAINGPADIEAWKYLWVHDSFPLDISKQINIYLQEWHDKFFVFHDKHPFYQVPDLNEEKATTIAILTPQLASGANRTLFDHSTDENPVPVSIDQAIRWVIAIQNYVLGGLTTPYDSERITERNKSARGGPLAQAALVIIKGKTFYKTLVLNLHQYNPLANIPYKFNGDDKPIWERDTYTQPYERIPKGLVDWYTFQPRAIKLIRNNGEDKILKTNLMVGEKLPKEVHRKEYEAMVAFTTSKSADPFPAIKFSEKKAVWRDFSALFQTFEGNHRPRTMDWISELMLDNIIKTDYFPLQLFGACSNQMSFILVQQETLPFNPRCLHDEIFMNNLNDNLSYVERVGKSLWTAARVIIINIIPDIAQKLETSKRLEKKDNKRIRKKIDNSNILSNFWNRAQDIFHEFLVQNLKDPDSINRSEWEKKNKNAGIKILKEFISSGNFDARSLKAGTLAIQKYYWRLKND